MARKIKLSPEKAYGIAKKASEDSNSFIPEGCIIWDSDRGLIFGTGFSQIPAPYTYSNSNEKIKVAEVTAFQSALVSLGKASKTKVNELECILYGEANKERLEDAKLLLNSGLIGMWLVDKKGMLKFHHATEWYLDNIRRAKISL